MSYPTITSFSPSSGYPVNPLLGGGALGSPITIVGTGFTLGGGVASVKVNGVAAHFTVFSDTSLVAYVPTAADNTGHIIVTSVDGSTVTSSGNFSTLNPPYIHDFTPLRAAVGDTVVIRGFNFTTVTAVTFPDFPGWAATFTVDNDNQITCTVPLGAGGGYIGVRNPDGATFIYVEFITLEPSDPPGTLLVTTPLYYKAPAFSWIPSTPQTAFQLRVRLQSGGGDVFNTGKTVSTTPIFALPWANRLLANAYTFWVKTWNEADLASTETSLNFTLTNAAPNAPSLHIEGGTPNANPTPTFDGFFTDPDTGDQAASAQLRITLPDDTTLEYSTGKIAATGIDSFTVPGGSALANGAYHAHLKYWDQDDQVGAETTLPFAIVSSLGNTTPTAPTVTIVGGTPQSDSTPDFHVTPLDADVGDMMTAYKFWITRDSDSQVMFGSSTVDVVQSGLLNVAFPVHCNNPLAPGNYTAHAKTKDSFAAESTATTLSFVISGLGDVTPPVVSITAPAVGLVSGVVRIIANATDNVGVVAVRFYCDGALLPSSTLSASNYPIGSPTGSDYYYDWNTLDPQWSLGGHTLSVQADDAAGNTGSANEGITISNQIADLQRKLVLVPMPTTGLAKWWSMAGNIFKKVITSVVVDTVNSDSFSNYLVQPMIHVPGDTVDPSLYQLLTDKVSSAILAKGATFRLLWLFTPLGLRTHIDTGTVDAIRLIVYGADSDGNGGKLGILCRAADGTGRVFSWDAATSTLTLIRSLSDFNIYTVNDFAYFGGRFYIAMEPQAGAPTGTLPEVRIVDAVNEDDSLVIPSHADRATYMPRALALYLDTLWIGYDDDSGHGQIHYTADGAKLNKAVGTIEGVTRLYGGTDVLLAGTSNGKVYNVNASAAALVYATGEASVQSLLEDSGTTLIGTGNSAKLFSNRTGSFALEAAMSTYTKLLALTPFLGHVFGSGNGNALWRRDLDSWTNADTYAGVTAINDLATYNGALYLATSPSGVVHRREVSPVPNGGVQAQKLRGVTAMLTDTGPAT